MDDFLRTAQSDWRDQPVELIRIRGLLRRRRWAPHLMLGLEILGGLAGFAVGLWFLWMVLTAGGLLYVLSAVVMLAAMPVSIVVSVIARRDALHWEDETPEGVLRACLVRAEASLRAIRIGQFGVAVVGAFVAVLWVAQASGLVRALDFLVIYSLASAGICLPYFLYLWWRTQQIRREQAACTRLMSDLSGADNPTE